MKQQDIRKMMRILARVFHLAYDIIGGLVLGVFVGVGLDHLFNTKAIFTLILSLWGIIHGFKMILKIGE